MKFSIIIPVYNVEKYISRCIRSILEQQYYDYEIILVDDGSKDNSGVICDKFADENEQITVVHVPNGGVSAARNLALKKASGEYVWFIDSDDYIEPGSLECLAAKIEKNNKPDLLIFDAFVTDEDGNKTGEIRSNLPVDVSMKFDTSKQLVFVNTSLWNRLFRRELIETNHLSFEPQITIAEDLLFNYKYLLACQNIYYMNEAFYYYIQRKNSAMSGAGKNKDVQKVFERLFAYYKEKDKYESFKMELEYLVIYHYFLVTSVRMIRCGAKKEECLTVPKWFQEQAISLSFKNIYVRKLPLKNRLVFVLIKMKLYGVVSLLFSKL